jgi:hypothetical protein
MDEAPLNALHSFGERRGGDWVTETPGGLKEALARLESGGDGDRVDEAMGGSNEHLALDWRAEGGLWAWLSGERCVRLAVVVSGGSWVNANHPREAGGEHAPPAQK